MTVSVFVGTSLDGFIARPNGDLDWLPAGGGEPRGYDEFMASVDALVIGRKTFEKVLSFEAWPYGDKRVQRLIITRVPVLIGEGIPLFGTLRKRATRSSSSSLVGQGIAGGKYHARLMIMPVTDDRGVVVGTIDVESAHRDAFTGRDHTRLVTCARALRPLWEQ